MGAPRLPAPQLQLLEPSELGTKAPPIAEPKNDCAPFSAGRILQIGMGWFPEQPGGLDRYFYELLQSLAQLRVDAIGLVAGSAAVGGSSHENVRAFAAADASIPARWRAVRRAVRQSFDRNPQPALCASHFALYTFPILGLIRSVPLVVHFHGPWGAESRIEGGGLSASAAKELLERAVYRHARLCIVLSKAFGRVLAQSYGVAEARIRVVPGGVNVSKFLIKTPTGELRRNLGWPTDRPIVLCVRRLARRMGLENLISAVAETRRNISDVLVLIVGRGILEGELRQRVKNSGLEQNIRLLGAVADEDLPSMYRAADLSIVPTQSLEGFGLTTIESLAAGTPVLVTPVGGLPEAVEELSPNLILADSSVAALSSGLSEGLRGHLNLPCRDSCQAFAAERYDWSIIAQRVMDIYREAMQC
jgi:glycosyltransferase involved in cell wall biosynthesis